jgi:Ca2+-binding RTX toxin-like protein
MIVNFTDYGRGLVEHLARLDPSFSPTFFTERASLPVGAKPVYYEQITVHSGGENFLIDLRFTIDKDGLRSINSMEVFDHSYTKVATALEIDVPVSAGSLLYKDDVLYLTGAVDRIYDGGGNDYVNLGAGNDLFAYTAGRDRIEGGAGLDAVALDVARGDVTIARSGAAWTVAGTGIDLNLTGVERLQFRDQTVAIDLAAGQTTGAVYRMYEAALDRVPDAGGLRYWVAMVDGGASLKDIAGGFLNSPEFKTNVGANLSDAAFVDALYQNVLERPGEQAGLDYWTGLLASGAATRSDVLIGFSESPENVAQLAPAFTDGLWLV